MSIAAFHGVSWTDALTPAITAQTSAIAGNRTITRHRAPRPTQQRLLITSNVMA
jgi:hypothetical protein